MDPVSVLSVLIGALIIAGRAPLIFAPTATLRFSKRLISTDARIRGWAIVLVPMAAALIVLAVGDSVLAGFLRFIGWLWALVAIWLLVAPSSYRRFAGGVLDFFESSVDEAIVRALAAVSVVIGGLFVYFGIVA